jgi:hypothetical protein
MRKLLLAIAAAPFIAGAAMAAEPLSDTQMDQVTGGATCPPDCGAVSNCPTCTSSFSAILVKLPAGPANLAGIFSAYSAFLSSQNFKLTP